MQIDKGMKHGQKIVLQGMANEEPGTLPGDVVFVLAQKVIRRHSLPRPASRSPSLFSSAFWHVALRVIAQRADPTRQTQDLRSEALSPGSAKR